MSLQPREERTIGGCPCAVFGDTGPVVVLVAAFPFSGALFTEVVRRLTQRVRVVVPELHHAPDSGLFSELVERLIAVVDGCEDPQAVVAHGLAVPLLLQAAERLPTPQLVVANGPVTRLDAITATLAAVCRAPGGKATASNTILRPGAFVRWLASSAGLRRAVVNPYVMDVETVEELALPLLTDARTRQKIAVFLSSIRATSDEFHPGERQMAAIWGDADALFPCAEAEFFASARYHGMHVAVPGGRFLFPKERPWELADALISILKLAPIDPPP